MVCSFSKLFFNMDFRNQNQQWIIHYFIDTKGNIMVFILLYVDDVVVTGNSDKVMKLKYMSHKRFHIKDLRPLCYFLGIEIDPTDRELKMSQHKYALDLLEKYNMKKMQTRISTTAFNRKLKAKDSPPFQNPENFRSVVGVYST